MLLMIRMYEKLSSFQLLRTVPPYSGRFPQIVQSGCISAAPSPILRKNLRFRASKKPEGDEPYPAK